MVRVPFRIHVPAQNPFNQTNKPGSLASQPFSGHNALAQNPISSNPIWRRPAWAYQTVNDAPRRGPQPRLSMGTGPTGGHSPSGHAPQLPGYVTHNEYEPSLFGYTPGDRQGFQIHIPLTINTGDNGRELVGTYNPHDFAIAQRFFHQARQAMNWQTMVFPPNVRNLLQWQQAQRYRISSLTRSARVLDSSQYFLGYQTNPQVSRVIGQTSLGYMGSQ